MSDVGMQMKLEVVLLPVSDVDRAKAFIGAAPGSYEGLQLTVADIAAAREDLIGRGVEVSEVFHDAGGIFHHIGTANRPLGGGRRRGDDDGD